MKGLINILDRITLASGRFASLFTHLLVLLICIDVMMRYLFSDSQIWIMEVEIYFFALIFLIGGGFAGLYNNHVRVDLWYEKLSPKNKALTDLIGGICLFLPWVLILTLVALEYAQTSYRIGEKSAQPGGLPYTFLLKSIIAVGFFFLLLQGVSQILKAIRYLLGYSDHYEITPAQLKSKQ